jgi:hypothetical protein
MISLLDAYEADSGGVLLKMKSPALDVRGAY